MAIAGKVAPIPKGEWSASENYEKLNIVRYNNMVFMAKINNKGVTPVDGDTWILLIQGESDIATLDFVGLVKPDGETIGVAEDGTLSVEKVSAENVYRADGSTTIEEELSKYIPSETIRTMPTPNGEHTYFVAGADNTFPYTYGLLEIRYGAGSTEYTATLKTTGDDKNFYYCVYRNGVWSAWERLIKESEFVKSINFSGTTNGGGGLEVASITEIHQKRWVSVKSTIANIFLENLANGYVLAVNASMTVLPNTGISGTLYYI